MFVSNLFLSAGTGQNVVQRSSEKAAHDNDFYSFLSKSMHSAEKTQGPGKQNASVVKANQRSVKNTNAVHENAQTHNTGDSATKKGGKTVGGLKQLQEHSVSGNKKLKGQDENLACLDEIMALLQIMNVLFVDTVLTDESATDAVFSEELESIINESVNRLLELAEGCEGETKELALNFAENMKQLLEEGFDGIISEGKFTIDREQLQGFVSKMLYEAANVKAELTSEQAGDSGIESEYPDDNGIMINEHTEVSETKQNSSQHLESDSDLKDYSKSNRASVDNRVNISVKEKSNDFNLLDDINRVMQNVTEINQTSDPDYSGSFRPVILTKTDLIQQIAEKAQVLVGSDKSEITLQLKPESLGKLQLQVVHERGEIVAKFMAENEQVKSILESNMQLLKDSLEKSGIDIQSLSVSVGQHNHSEGNDNYNEQYAHTHMQRIIYEDISDVVNEIQTYRYTGLSGELYGSMESEINLIA